MSTLLLSQLIPRESVELGRLVVDPKYPDHDFCQPLLTGTSDAPFAAADVATQHFEDFSAILNRTRGTRLELRLLSLLSIVPSVTPGSTSSTVLTAPVCAVHRLRDATTYFSAACREQPVREWLESRPRRPFGNIFLVCGLRTVTNARVRQTRHSQIDVAASVSVPAASLPGFDVTVEGSLSVACESKEKVGYTAVGEQVFAVQYRKVNLSMLSTATKKVEEAYLERKIRFISYISLRGGQVDKHVIEAEVAEALTQDDLMGTYESFDLAGEQILYRI
ncbi:hypothetical protein RB595_010508 [Gaeumannomyces hyphopodioides]